MEFPCVLSVGGSLVCYIITKQSDAVYTATLKEGPSKCNDLPEFTRLEKGITGWKAEPWQEEIVRGLPTAIELA